MVVAIRGFVHGKRVFEDHADFYFSDLEEEIAKLAEQHIERLKHEDCFMIEFEFLDVAGPNERFLRFGTDPSGMVIPIQINLSGGDS